MTEKYKVSANGGGFAVIDSDTNEIAFVFNNWADAYEHAARLNMVYTAPCIVEELRSRND